MTLCLHTGAGLVNPDELRALPMPAPTPTHVPVAHADVVEMLRYALGFYGHEVTEEHHAVTPDGARYFGILSLRSAHGAGGEPWTDTVGLRNSHDKTFPIGIAFGARVFVCDNLSFSGDHVIRRRHTAHARRDLPGLVAEVIAPLRERRLAQARALALYQETPLDEARANDAILTLYRRGVIGVTRIADILEGWEAPPYDWGGKTAWRLFNAATHALNGRIAENPATTRTLHEVIDGVCERAA